MLPALKRFKVFQYFRIRPFDTSHEEGRSDERQRRAVLTMIADIFARGSALLVMILTLRVSLPYLGQEQFGILATIISFSTILMALDLGIGNALVGQVAKVAAKDYKDLPDLLSRALWVLILLGATATGLLLLLANFAPIAWAFKGASPNSLLQCRNTLTLFAILFGASIPLGAIKNVYHGLQRGYLVHLVNAAFTVTGLGFLYLLTRFHAKMPAFLFVGYGMQVLSGAALLLPLAFKGFITAPRLDFLMGQETKNLLRVGGLFFFLQIGVMAGWGADPLILSAKVGPFVVVIFTLADRAAQLISIPLYIFNKPLWAGYADALARHDKAYILSTLKRSMVMTGSTALIVSSILLYFRTPIFNFLGKNVAQVPLGFFALYLTWIAIRSLGDCLAMYMNGVHVLKPQLILLLLFIATSIPAKLIFVGPFGLFGFVMASILSYILASVIPIFTIFRKDIFAAAL